MAQLKTQKTKASVEEFLSAVENEKRRQDARTVMKLMQRITGCRPRMWGPSMIGFGSYRYQNVSGRGGEWFLTGLSPRKQALTVYIMAGFSNYDALLGRLGKFKTGKSCLYINKLEDVDLSTLEQLITESFSYMKEKYPDGDRT